MRKLLLTAVLIVLCMTMGALMAGSVVAQDALPAFGDLAAGEWNEILPGGETTCAHDTPYRFFVRPAEQPSEKLHIYFEGGGACWNGENCAADYIFPQTERPLYKQAVPENNMESYPGGLFDFANAENPVADYNTVVVPYCTGDIHWGNATQEYTSASGETYTMNHKGFVNASAVLDWTYANIENPSDLLISGTSAGALGQIMHAPYIIDQYPDAHTVYFADSYVGVGNRNWQDHASWGAFGNFSDSIQAYTDMTEDTYFNASRLYRGMASAYPDVVFSEFTSYLDSTQIFFYFLTGGGATPEEAGGNFVAGKSGLLTGLSANLPNFRYYQSWGNIHGIIAFPDFYTYQVRGTRLRDWLADLLAGNDVRNINCGDGQACAIPELYEPAA